jgi:uncharacterized protein (DUF2461 family)
MSGMYIVCYRNGNGPRGELRVIQFRVKRDSRLSGDKL